MGVVGNKPDAELEDLLGFVEEVQMATPICAVGDKLLAASPHKAYTHFMAHGMASSATKPRGSWTAARSPTPATTSIARWRPGMVLSIETTMNHPKRGLIKIEDTVLVTDSGWKGLGDGVRGLPRTAG
jgi:Xaa-Pro aminopeptidase